MIRWGVHLYKVLLAAQIKLVLPMILTSGRKPATPESGWFADLLQGVGELSQISLGDVKMR
jgi:hypothetical protein